MIIAIDGPAGAGKSTVCKILAKRLGFVYLDTGAMYRAVAWALEAGLSLGDSPRGSCGDEQFGAMLERMQLQFAIDKNSLVIFYGQKTLSDELRSPEITEAASRISRLPAVREFLVAWQRNLAGQGTGIVAEGRDTATVVFPNAELKVFLTADLKTRAKRRFAEYAQKGEKLSLEQIEVLIRERDEADSKRDHSPMRPAQGAVLVDTSALSVDQVVDLLGEKAENLIQTRC
ncbi:MAG: (d)CMP kinase [Deltaproteobacteria bacterium]|nr:(d)CMP kinase [Deltaproteobacteria bacterium]MDA8306853.1 (d)CMP kinase [Deltaproteobacteria bacterium]